MQGAIKGERAPKAQLKAKVYEVVRLLQAALEGMGDAAPNLNLPQFFEQRISASAHMENDWQAMSFGNFELFAVEMALAFKRLGCVEFGDKTV